MAKTNSDTLAVAAYVEESELANGTPIPMGMSRNYSSALQVVLAMMDSCEHFAFRNRNTLVAKDGPGINAQQTVLCKILMSQEVDCFCGSIDAKIVDASNQKIANLEADVGCTVGMLFLKSGGLILGKCDPAISGFGISFKDKSGKVVFRHERSGFNDANIKGILLDNKQVRITTLQEDNNATHHFKIPNGKLSPIEKFMLIMIPVARRLHSSAS